MKSARRRAALILNANAGSGIDEGALTQLKERFIAQGRELILYRARDGAQLAEYADQAVKQQIATVIAAGGDGTLSTVANALKNSQSTLGVLPWGTLNHFAKDLKIPFDLESATQVILEGHSISVDLGEVNGRGFINNSSLGLYAHAVRERDAQRRRSGRGKVSAFFWAGLSLLRIFPMLHIRVLCDGQPLFRRTPFVLIGNNEYALEGLHMAQRANLQEGQLNLYMSRGTGRLGLLRLAWLALWGGLRQARDFDALKAREITIETRRPRLRVALDGEVFSMSTPLRYRVLPGALRVLVPRPEAG